MQIAICLLERVVNIYLNIPVLDQDNTLNYISNADEISIL